MIPTALPSPDLEVTLVPGGDDDIDIPTRSCKRKRGLPITPPASVDDPESAKTLERAVHVLTTEATALSFVSRLYQTDPNARTGLLRAVECVVDLHDNGGKLVICGIGKSGYIGMKIVATLKSMGIPSSFLHAAEALHGDLGDIRRGDAVLFITYSGRTPELMIAASHIPLTVPVLAITAHTDMALCPLLQDRPDAILLPAPIHETEESTFGICAPTTSTTVAIAVGDMLALTAADRIHGKRAEQVFKGNHPGGAIGAKR